MTWGHVAALCGALASLAWQVGALRGVGEAVGRWGRRVVVAALLLRCVGARVVGVLWCEREGDVGR